MAATTQEAENGLRSPVEGTAATENPKAVVTCADLLALPAFVNLRTAAGVLGLGRSTAYELSRRDAFPCRVLKAGRAYRVPSEELRRLAGVEAPPVTTPHRHERTCLQLPHLAAASSRAGRCPNCYARVHRLRGAQRVHP
jgi:predicted DNA-binding transcriptional regulator AlpA